VDTPTANANDRLYTNANREFPSTTRQVGRKRNKMKTYTVSNRKQRLSRAEKTINGLTTSQK
jgi:hypothetical protein